VLDALAPASYHERGRMEYGCPARNPEFVIEVPQGNWASAVTDQKQVAEVLNYQSWKDMKQEVDVAPNTLTTVNLLHTINGEADKEYRGR
jgi:hypothetical protein